MPNHVTNRLTLEGPKASEIMKALAQVKGLKAEAITGKKLIFKPATEINLQDRGNTGCILDFNKIIPMPTHIYRGDLGPEEEKKYGKANCWYEWSINNWGTKWNAYECERINQTTIQFQTAWSMPKAVVMALSYKNPKLLVKIKWADENAGEHCGEVHYKDGVMVYNHIPKSNSKEAYELSFELNPDAREYHRYNEAKGTYEYHDDDDNDNA